LVFSLPELLVALGMSMNRIPGWHGIPLMEHGLGWLLPFGATLLLNVFWHLWNTFKKGQKMYF
jgi:branched-subunit amino acid permease